MLTVFTTNFTRSCIPVLKDFLAQLRGPDICCFQSVPKVVLFPSPVAKILPPDYRSAHLSVRRRGLFRSERLVTFSRFPIDAYSNVTLKSERDAWTQQVLVTFIRVPDIGTVVVLNVPHPTEDGRGTEYDRCAEAVLALTKHYGLGRVIICGHFGFSPGSSAYEQFIEAGYRNASVVPTFPLPNPDRCMDYIFVRGLKLYKTNPIMFDSPDCQHAGVFAWCDL